MTNQSVKRNGTDAPVRKPVVIVTGSSGLIGGAVIDALRKRYQVVGFDLDGEPQPPPEVECVCVDLTDDESVHRGLERVRFAYGDRVASVIHLAAYYDFAGEPSDLYEKVTVEGTRRLLTRLRAQGFDVEQFVFSSTMLAHKPTDPGRPISEATELEGKWDYPESKIRTERVIREERGDIPALLMRIAGVYTDECGSIPIAHQIQRIAERRLTANVSPGDISHGQAFVHLSDLISAIVLAVTYRRSLGEEEAVLIGEPETYSYDQIQRRLGLLLHDDRDWTTQEIPKTVARSGAWVQGKIPGVEEPFIKPWMIDMADDHYELDISKARSTLQWEPEHRLIDALDGMVERLRDDWRGWYERQGLATPPEQEVEAPSIAHLEV